MTRSEFDASRALSAAAGVTDTDPLEMTQFMPVRDRRYRQMEARMMHADGMRLPDFRDDRCRCQESQPIGYHYPECPRAGL